MVFKCINKLFRDLLFVLRLRKKKILVFSNHPSDYSDPFEDFRIISGLKSSIFDNPTLCSSFTKFIIEVRKGYDIVHLALHGKDELVDISDNELNIRHDRLKGLFFKNIYTELVFLNVCKSHQLAREISENVKYTIGWTNNPSQEDCKQLCEDFYNHYITSNGSIADAYNRTSEGKQDCHLFIGNNIKERFNLHSAIDRLRFLILALIVTILVFVSIFILRANASPKIIEPADNGVIINPCQVFVSASLLNKKSNLWIFVGISGYKDVWWPQGKAEKTEGKWKLVVNCGNENDYGIYKICAMVVNTNTDKDLLNWVDSQGTDSKMEPLADLPSGSFCYKSDIIRVKRTN